MRFMISLLLDLSAETAEPRTVVFFCEPQKIRRRWSVHLYTVFFFGQSILKQVCLFWFSFTVVRVALGGGTEDGGKKGFFSRFRSVCFTCGGRPSSAEATTTVGFTVHEVLLRNWIKGEKNTTEKRKPPQASWFNLTYYQTGHRNAVTADDEVRWHHATRVAAFLWMRNFNGFWSREGLLVLQTFITLWRWKISHQLWTSS